MEFFINITLKSSLILIGSGIILIGLKKAPATLRHWIISLTMIGLLGLPILTEIVPTIQVEVSENLIPPKKKQLDYTVLNNRTVIVANNLENKESVPIFREESKIVQPTDNQHHRLDNVFAIPAISPMKVVVFIWLIGFVLFSIKFIRGYLEIRRITIDSLPFVLPNSLKKFVNQLTQKQVNILRNESIKTPMTWGGLNPVILLPKSAAHWSEKELKTVLLHELIHIKRNDYWLHNLGLLAVCFYWYNPLIWMMKKQQLLEREKACDEAVIRAGVAQQSYAEQLVEMTKQLAHNRTMMRENALPMAKISQTKARIIAILNFNNSRFRFLKWKQWNWGIFYTILFPVLAAFSPIDKEIIGDNNPLPKLATISQKIVTEGLRNIEFLTPNILQKNQEESIDLVKDSSGGNTKTNELLESDELDTISNLSPNPPMELPDKLTEIPINIPKKALKKGLFGKWKKGNSEFGIWAYGEFEILDKAPYIKVISPDGIVYLEEYINEGTKGNIHQYTFAKLPYDVRERPDFRDKININKDKLIKKGEQIEIWSRNKAFLFFNRQKDAWLKDHINEIKQQVEGGVVQPVTQEHKEWWERIKGIPRWIDFNYIPEKEVQEQLTKKRRSESIRHNKVPYRKLDHPQNLGEIYSLGRKILSGSTASGSLGMSPVGQKFTTVIEGKATPTLLNTFNFHLGENDFKSLIFELSLFNIKDGEITHSLLKEPIPIEVSSGNGWVSKDLSNYKLMSQGDILIVLKNTAYTGSKRKKRLYFSWTGNNNFTPLFDREGWKPEYLELPFIMYFDAQDGQENAQSMTLPASSKENILHGRWKIGNSTFKFWATDDLKIYNNMPYLETTSPDGIIVIEECQKKLLGTKTCQMVITKAPYDGKLVQSFLNGKPNSTSDGFKKGDPLYLYLAKNDWVFLGKGKDKWMMEHMPKLVWRIRNLQEENTTTDAADLENKAANLHRKMVIEYYRTLKATRFLSVAEEEEKVSLPIRNLENIADIPVQKINRPAKVYDEVKIGRRKLSKFKSGFSGYGRNIESKFYGTVLKNEQQRVLQDLNVHLDYNKFEQLYFDVYLFKIVGDEIQYRLNEEPIRVNVGNQAGWISKDIGSHNISVDGDVLVVLELTDYKAKNAGLFFTLASNYEAYQVSDKLYKGTKLLFEEHAFALNLTAN